jgi:hypothetical protein
MPELACEPTLKRGVLTCKSIVCTKRSAKDDVCRELSAVHAHDIEVLVNGERFDIRIERLWRRECLSTRDPEITETFVAEPGQSLDDGSQPLRRFDHHVDIDDRLCRQTRHRRAADVLDGDNLVTQRGSE